jgi:AhpD family alkylhydroperoxidase
MDPSSKRELTLCGFAAAMAVQRPAVAARALKVARRSRLPRRAAEEAALMLVLYSGYPAALEALRVLNEVWPGTARPSRESGRALWRWWGMERCRRVYGDALPKLIAHVRELHPDLAVWMIEEGYGRVLSRPRLDARTREFVTVAVLAATGWRRQLVSHLRGAHRLGATASEIRAAYTTGLELASRAAKAAGRDAWREFEHRVRSRPAPAAIRARTVSKTGGSRRRAVGIRRTGRARIAG